MAYTKYHPVFLDLNHRLVVIVGGGSVAVEKIVSLLPSGARLRVVAPAVNEEIRAWYEQGDIEWLSRQFADTDVEGAFAVIAATDDPVLNAHIFRIGEGRAMLANSVDDPDNCNFIMAAIAGAGPIQVAISSAGCSPALAQRVRTRIREEILTDEVGVLGEFLGDWRPRLKADLPTYRHRKGFWERVIDSDIPGVLASQGRDEANRAMEEAIVWSREHLSCLVCSCKTGGFVCPEGR